MAINKVKYGNTTLIDLTGTTATADKILTGYGAYGRDGVWINGTAHQGGGIESVTQDQDGYVVLDDDEGNQIIVDSLSVTTNGTYTAGTGHAYSPVSVSVTPNLIAKTVTPTATGQIVLPEETTETSVITGNEVFNNIYYTNNDHPGTIKVLVTDIQRRGALKRYRYQFTVNQYSDNTYTTVIDSLDIDQIITGARGQTIATSKFFQNLTLYDAGSSGYVLRALGNGYTTSVYFNIPQSSFKIYEVTTETYDGLSQVTVNGDADLVAGNIKKDVEIFGVTGTYEGSGGGGSGDIKGLIDKSITSLTLPSDLTLIGEYAFYRCNSLTITAFPNGITEIGQHAFDGVNITASSLPDSVITIGNYAFYQSASDHQKVTFSTLPSSLVSIGNYAFINTDVSISIIPSTVTSIGRSAFNGCVNITSISCDGNITTLGGSAFGGGANGRTSNLVTALFPNLSVATLSQVFGSSTSTYACRNLEVLDIGKTQKIATSCFRNCTKLATLIIRTTSVCTLNRIDAFTGTPFQSGSVTYGTVYVPSNLISDYQVASLWSNLYNGGSVVFEPIEGSPYEL